MTTNTPIKKTALATALIAGLLANATNAAPTVVINQGSTASSTLVEQYADGKTTTIAATPNGISMRDGAPFYATQITTIPRYTISQGASTVVTTSPVVSAPITGQVTQQISNTVVTTPITTPVTAPTQVLTPITTTVPIVNHQVISTPAVNSSIANNQVVSTASIDTLQLTPTFSTPNVATANTKIMKILKNSAGRDIAVPANNIAPGDVIEYHTTYVNNSAQPLGDLNATVTLPNGVQLVSLNSPLSTMGTIGGDNYQTIGQMGNDVVIQQNYSGLRWNLVNLATNEPQTVVIRAKVQ